MDIRTRLSLALVFVSLLSMMLLGSFAYYTSSNLLLEISLRQLDALAESKRRDLDKVYDGWEDHLRLVREIKELRYAIRNYTEYDEPQALRTIQNTIQRITVAVKEIDLTQELLKTTDLLSKLSDSERSTIAWMLNRLGKK